MIRTRLLVAAFGCVTALAPAAAHEFKAGTLTIDHPSSRMTPPGAKTGVGYVTIHNDGAEPDRLIGGSAVVAGRFEIHTSTVEDGVARMRRVQEGVVIGPGETVSLKSGGTHVMLLGLEEPLVEGQLFEGSLVFERAGTIPIQFLVGGLGAASPAPVTHEGHTP